MGFQLDPKGLWLTVSNHQSGKRCSDVKCRRHAFDFVCFEPCENNHEDVGRDRTAMRDDRHYNRANALLGVSIQEGLRMEPTILKSFIT